MIKKKFNFNKFNFNKFNINKFNFNKLNLNQFKKFFSKRSSITVKKNKKLDNEKHNDFGEIEKKIIKILDEKIKPAVARDGGDIKFKEFKNGIVTVQLQGSCSGCPSSIVTLKQGVQNLLRHYIPEVKEVISV